MFWALFLFSVFSSLWNVTVMYSLGFRLSFFRILEFSSAVFMYFSRTSTITSPVRYISPRTFSLFSFFCCFCWREQ